MDLTLKNIGIIKDSTIIVDGLTVITGKNSSGKTTVGKTVHSILRANRDAENAFLTAKRDYLRSRIDRMVDVLSPRVGYSVVSRIRYNNEKSVKENRKGNLAFFLSRSYRRLESEELEYFLEFILNMISEVSFDVFLNLFENVYREREINSSFIERYKESFSERKQIAIDIGNKTLETLNSETAFRSFLHLRIQEFLNEDFNNQIKPVRNNKALSQIVMKGIDQTYIDVKIRSKDDFEFQEESSFVFPYEHSVFIDNPFILDRIGNDEYNVSYHSTEYTLSDNLIHSTDIKSYSDDLEGMLKTDLNENFFNMQDFQEKYHAVFEKINEIVPGEFLETKDGEFYVSDGKKLNIHNLATGSKLFFLIKQLMIKGHIGEGTLLILDEPESHLHPEWINRFAEIITILIKDMGVHVIITTHSPNLLLALNVYTKQNQMEGNAHFYLAKRLENNWISNIENIDDNIGEGYGHLSVPFLEMSYLKKHEDEAHE